jgi:Putative MetA-pathway of phenol degradation
MARGQKGNGHGSILSLPVLLARLPCGLAGAAFLCAGTPPLITAFLPTSLLAGPPFLTDDPEPVDYDHWEINNYSSSVFAKGATFAAAPGSDINYGILPEIQAHVNVALAVSSTSGDGTSYGPGDLELGVKYRFLDAKPEDWWPQIAVYPFLDLPTGDASRGLGTGSVHAFLPLWLQKSFGKWTAFGGGGYWFNPGPGNRDYWFAGGVLMRQVTGELQLGVELYHETKSSTNAPGTPGFPIGTEDTTGFNIGGIYDFDKTYHLLFSAGRGLENAAASNEFSYYIALRITF